MPKKNSKVETEPDLYGSSNDQFEYLPTERNKEREKISINYSNSFVGRSGAAIGRFNLKLRKIYDRAILYLTGRTVVFATFLIKGIDKIGIILYNEYCNKKLRKDKKTMSKSNNKTDKNTKNNSEAPAKNSKRIDFKAWGRGIIGIMTLLVVISIAHSAWIIVHGTDNQTNLVMAIPMVIWAVLQLIKQFTKQGAK